VAVHARAERRPHQIADRAYTPVAGVGGQRLCLVAEGAADVADMNDISSTLSDSHAYKQWDLAASHAIVRAAGGELVAMGDGQPVQYQDPEFKMPGAIAGGREMLHLLQLAKLPNAAGRAR
jgi:3'(2'), 5'-bisphosphate nucleotidase